jgi:hypothetical protein
MDEDALPPASVRRDHFLIALNLPVGKQFTTWDVYPHVYGHRLSDGAKPWPHLRDARSRKWFGLFTADETPIDALVWLIPFDQLAYKAAAGAERYLGEILFELKVAAAHLGASIEPESSIPAALEKMNQVIRELDILNHRVRIIVAAPDGQSYRVAQWVHALKGAGLQWGDGDLFWYYDRSRELFCAEPYSSPGYFHPGDIGTQVAFSDVALHFVVRRARQPAVVLRCMNDIALQIADELGAAVLTTDGFPFNLKDAERELDAVLPKIASVQRTRGA